jgi:hypothetical protein
MTSDIVVELCNFHNKTLQLLASRLPGREWQASGGHALSHSQIPRKKANMQDSMDPSQK